MQNAHHPTIDRTPHRSLSIPRSLYVFGLICERVAPLSST
jgi:hypothetical protein